MDKEKCISCFQCTQACPSKALTYYGDDYTPEQLARELRKDKVFFESSGGGVTLSGGEVLMQADFVLEVAKLLKADGIEIALDTCCYGNKKKLLQLADVCDLFLVDIKLLDPKRHKACTGQDNAVILENICALGEALRSQKEKHIWIRTPIVPGYTDDEENIHDIGRFIHDMLPDEVVEKWELILFHNMCRSKYQELWLSWPHEHTPLVTETQVDKLKKAMEETGIPSKKMHIAGLAIKDKKEK